MALIRYHTRLVTRYKGPQTYERFNCRLKDLKLYFKASMNHQNYKREYSNYYYDLSWWYPWFEWGGWKPSMGWWVCNWPHEWRQTLGCSSSVTFIGNSLRKRFFMEKKVVFYAYDLYMCCWSSLFKWNLAITNTQHVYLQSEILVS